MPTPDIAAEDAMDEQACAATIAFGMEAIAGGTDLLCLGEMGIGNTTVAAAILCALYGGAPAEWVGPGTGVDADGLARKTAAVADAVARLGGERDPLEILRRLGGREIAALVGAILAARLQRVPVLLDGYVVAAAAAVVHAHDPRGLDHCLAAHRSAEPAHGAALTRMGLEPLFDFGLRLGEASGAALAVPLVRTALAIHAGMATFDQAGVARKS
jgi:nicotinate-nucleotide--dimethylbenzimidazole phosphoribosyltransferase